MRCNGTLAMKLYIWLRCVYITNIYIGGQVLVMCWSSFGQVLVMRVVKGLFGCWSSDGQVLVKRWSSVGQVLIK